MKQFKHIISGHIATESKSGKTYSIANQEKTTLPKEFIEYSCDWLLIEPEVIDNRDYEVLSYANNSDSELWIKVSDSNKYYRETAKHIYLSEADLCVYATIKISVIQRKSDGAIFRIGTYVTPSYSEMVYGEVRKFEPVGNTIQIWGNFNGLYGMGFLNQLNPLVPKDYEVLELVNPENNSKLKLNNGICTSISTMPNAPELAIAQAISMLDWSTLDIIKIQRYSDGEVFEVGGLIRGKNSTKNFNISAIKKASASGILQIYIENYSYASYLLDEINAVRPVFMTEDGIFIFIGDEYFAIEEYYKGFTVVPYVLSSVPNGIRQYSTHKAAAEGLNNIKNTNVSIFDIEKVFGTLDVHSIHELLKISKRNVRD